MILDAHSHILPAIDDGAKNEQEALRLLNMLKSQGVSAALATPHFYNYKHSPEEYILKAKTALEKLKKASGFNDIYLGFEVKYFKGMSNAAYLKNLTLGKTNYLLVELDWGGITDSAIDEIANLKPTCGLTPVLAHVERYSYYANYDKAINLVESGKALAQLNVDSVLMGVNKTEAIYLANQGFYSLIGSDTHSLLGRPPKIKEFFEKSQGIISETSLKKIEDFSSKLLNDIKGLD